MTTEEREDKGGGARRLDDIQKQAARTMYLSGKTINDVAKHFGVSRQAMNQLKKRQDWDNGGPTSIVKAKKKRVISNIKEDEVLGALPDSLPGNNPKLDDVCRSAGLSRMDTKKVSDAIVALEAGMSIEHAAMYALISPDTLRDWIKKNSYLKQQILKAKADFEFANIDNIQKQAERDAKHSQWLLEHSSHTRSQYGNSNESSGGIQIVFNFERSPDNVPDLSDVIDVDVSDKDSQ